MRQQAGSRERTYSVYGLAIASDHEFALPLPETTAAATIAVARRAEAPPPPPDNAASIPYRTHAGPAALLVFRRADRVVLRFETVAEFEISSDEIRCRPIAPVREREIELTLLGPVLAVAASLGDRLALHASAVALEDGSVVGFLAGSRGGKTSLSCALMQRGAALVTDDILVVDPETSTAFPAWPEVRLWPEAAAHFHGPIDALPRVSSAFDKRRVPVGTHGRWAFRGGGGRLARLYLPERREPGQEIARGVGIEPVTAIAAAREILSNSFAARTLAALGDSPRHLDRVLALLDRTTVHRICYPSGLEELPTVCQAIEADVAAPVRPVVS